MDQLGKVYSESAVNNTQLEELSFNNSKYFLKFIYQDLKYL